MVFRGGKRIAGRRGVCMQCEDGARNGRSVGVGEHINRGRNRWMEVGSTRVARGNERGCNEVVVRELK